MSWRPVTNYQASYNKVLLTLGRIKLQGYDAKLRGSILCGPPPLAHTQEVRIQEHHKTWAQTHELCDDHIVDELAFWGLWTDCVSECETTTASIVPDYCLMYTVLDDAAEKFFGKQGAPVEIVISAFNNFAKILEGKKINKSKNISTYPKYEQLCQVLSDLKIRIQKNSTGIMYPMFLEGFERYRRGVIQQIYFSKLSMPMSRETQIYNRHLNVAFDPTVILICMLNQTDFAKNLLEHPLLERLHMIICRLGAVINDIISFPKEIAESEELGQYQNLIAAEFADALRTETLDNPLAYAIKKVFAFHNSEMEDFFLFTQHISTQGSIFARYCKTGLDMHRSWMNWCLSAKRYCHFFTSSQRIEHEETFQYQPIKQQQTSQEALYKRS